MSEGLWSVGSYKRGFVISGVVIWGVVMILVNAVSVGIVLGTRFVICMVGRFI